MGYNKAKAEKKWKEWKNKEENLLRKLGMNEDKIDELYNYDKELFNSERSFLRRTIIDCQLIRPRNR